MTRVAAIDLGTNTTRLLVADVADGRVAEIERRQTITRLGEGVDARRRLLPLPIARVRNCLTAYRRRAEELGAERVLAIGTSALRDAENGEAFLGEIEWSYGFDTRLLSGDEEALLAFRGVASGREVAEGTLVVDVGGGSTELILGGPHGVEYATSLAIGSVRMTERFLTSDPPRRDELTACAGAVSWLLAEHVPDEVRHAVRTAVGVAASVTTLAALDLGLEEYDRERVHGHALPADGVDDQLARLASLPLEERRRIPALEPERAPVIVAGAGIVREVLRHFGLAELEVSELDILDGAALAAAELPEREEGAAPPGAYTCC
ncbi:MAG: Ppx/GppA family phosphatase [Thermoleophilia bacterium]|nr:Ppx/GppA family phosphatase [Thermoleophilia bacterium]